MLLASHAISSYMYPLILCCGKINLILVVALNLLIIDLTHSITLCGSASMEASRHSWPG